MTKSDVGLGDERKNLLKDEQKSSLIATQKQKQRKFNLLEVFSNLCSSN